MNNKETKGHEILEQIYDKSLNGIPKVSKPLEELVEDYTNRYGYTDEAIDRLIANQLKKNTINGFVTGFGGFSTMAVTLPANVTSVLYVQMRMIAAIAYIRGYDLNEDTVQTFVYACMIGKSSADIFKKASVQFSNKLGNVVLKKIPGRVLININKKLGFRFITKGGTKGVINLWKAVPLVGAGVGSTYDYTTTKVIANRAKKMFIENGQINIGALEGK